MATIQFQVNGAERRIEGDPGRALLWVLRDELELTGAKYGCGEGQCGACTVLIDGVATRSCITPLGQVADKRVTTIEGMERDGRLHPVQSAFLEHEALQCGYCTPGMVMSAVGLLAKNPKATDAQIVEGLEGNICRCGTYPRIVAAVRRASR